MIRSHFGVRATGVTILLGTLLILTLCIAGISLHAFLLAAITLALVLPMGVRHIQGKLDLFEPLVTANVAFGVMFIGRPLADLATHTTIHLGYDVTITFDETLLLVLVGILAFQFGYHSPFSRKWSRKLHKPAQFRPQHAIMAAWLFFILGGILFSMFLAKGGGIGLLLFLLKGRAPQDNLIFLNSTGYFYSGILMWAASALIFFALATALKRRSYYVWFIAMALPLIVFFGASGTRSQLLPLVLAVPVFWYLWKRRRPSARTLIVTAVIGVALIGWQREIRTAGDRYRKDSVATLIQALSSPGEQTGEILGGADDEMFDSLANELLVVPRKIGFRPGGSLTDLFIRAVPRPLWQNKPLETNDAVVNALWPAHYAQSRAAPAFSILGPFYADSGFIGVAFGMYLIGVFLAVSWRWFLRHRHNLNALLIYSMGLPFVVILSRGSLPDTLSRMLFMVFPLVLMMWLTRLRVLPNRPRRPTRAGFNSQIHNP